MILLHIDMLLYNLQKYHFFHAKENNLQKITGQTHLNFMA